MVRPITLAFLLLAACGMVRAEDFPVDQRVAKVVTLASPDQQYALYLPPGYSRSRRWPVLIMLDPRGRAEAMQPKEPGIAAASRAVAAAIFPDRATRAD